MLCNLFIAWRKQTLFVSSFHFHWTWEQQWATSSPPHHLFCKLPQAWTFKWPSPACVCHYETLLKPAPLCAAFILHSATPEFLFLCLMVFPFLAHIHCSDTVQRHKLQGYNRICLHAVNTMEKTLWDFINYVSILEGDTNSMVIVSYESLWQGAPID